MQPGAGASSSSRRRHGVSGHCGECASARARGQAPPGLGQGSGKPGNRGGRRKLLSAPGKRRLSRSFAPHSRSAPPPRAPLSARGREENIVHVTRKRDSVDPCVSGAGLRVLAWDWMLQAVGFCVVGPQRSIREGAGRGRVRGDRPPGNLAPSWFHLQEVTPLS